MRCQSTLAVFSSRRTQNRRKWIFSGSVSIWGRSMLWSRRLYWPLACCCFVAVTRWLLPYVTIWCLHLLGGYPHMSPSGILSPPKKRMCAFCRKVRWCISEVISIVSVPSVNRFKDARENQLSIFLKSIVLFDMSMVSTEILILQKAGSGHKRFSNLRFGWQSSLKFRQPQFSPWRLFEITLVLRLCMLDYVQT